MRSSRKALFALLFLQRIRAISFDGIVVIDNVFCFTLNYSIYVVLKNYQIIIFQLVLDWNFSMIKDIIFAKWQPNNKPQRAIGNKINLYFIDKK